MRSEQEILSFEKLKQEKCEDIFHSFRPENDDLKSSAGRPDSVTPLVMWNRGKNRPFSQQTSWLMVAFILMMTSFYTTVSVQGSGHTILNVISYHLCRHGSQKKNNTSDPNVTEVWRFEVAVVMLYTCCPDQCNVTHHSYRYIKLSPLCCEMQNVCGTLLR